MLVQFVIETNELYCSLLKQMNQLILLQFVIEANESILAQFVIEVNESTCTVRRWI